MNREGIIDKILRNEPLTPAEQSWWNDHQANEEVQDDLAMIHEIEGSLRLENRNLLKAQLQGFEQRKGASPAVMQDDGKSPIYKMTNWWKAAAAVVILAASITLLYQNSGSDYLSEYYEPYPSIIDPVVKGARSNGDPTSDAMREYQNKNYQLAIGFLDQTGPLNDTLLFYKANALISIERHSEALMILQNLSRRDNRFRQESGWYEVLLLLNSKKKVEAVTLLESITTDKAHPYFKEASDLLLKIQ